MLFRNVNKNTENIIFIIFSQMHTNITYRPVRNNTFVYHFIFIFQISYNIFVFFANIKTFKISVRIGRIIVIIRRNNFKRTVILKRNNTTRHYIIAFVLKIFFQHYNCLNLFINYRYKYSITKNVSSKYFSTYFIIKKNNRIHIRIRLSEREIYFTVI